MDVIVLFPGQGSQKPGMGRELCEAFPTAREVFQRADDALKTPLSTLCFSGPAEELTLTHNAQPALFTHGAGGVGRCERRHWRENRGCGGALCSANIPRITPRARSAWSTAYGSYGAVVNLCTRLVCRGQAPWQRS